MDTDEWLKEGKVKVWKGRFAVIKAEQDIPGAFCTIQDHQEKTVIIDQSKLTQEPKHIQKGFCMLTFDMLIPFGMVGFLAKIGRVLADSDISILSYAAYSSDHIMVQEHDLEKTVGALKSLGLKIIE